MFQDEPRFYTTWIDADTIVRVSGERRLSGNVETRAPMLSEWLRSGLDKMPKKMQTPPFMQTHGRAGPPACLIKAVCSCVLSSPAWPTLCSLQSLQQRLGEDGLIDHAEANCFPRQPCCACGASHRHSALHQRIRVWHHCGKQELR